MSVPFPPQFTNDDSKNIKLIIAYLYDLHSYLVEGDPNVGWVVNGVVEDKVLTVGDTLADTQHFLGTLAQVLIDKNTLGA